jgi:GWxTD domain-containing protein
LICSATVTTCRAFRSPLLGGAASLVLLWTLACGAPPPRARSAADLTNPFLGPEQSSWLIGPIGRMATPEEVEAYLAATDEAQAAQLIDQFWARRDPNPDRPGNPLREAFDERSVEADRLFSEAGYRGRRTDRGTIFVVYGPPAKTEFEISPGPGQPAVEAWHYSPTTPAGLDGRKPAAIYRFIKRGDLTVTYFPGQTDPRLRDRQPPVLPPE